MERKKLELPKPEINLPPETPKWATAWVAEKLNSESPFDWAVAAAIVYRNAPAIALDSAREAGLERTLAQTDPLAQPRKGPQEWFESLSDAQRGELEKHVGASARLLERDLDVLDEMLTGDPGGRLEIARQALYEREELEGLVELLEQGGRKDHLRSLLRLVDDVGTDLLTTLGAIDGLHVDARLHAIAWQDPGAWWLG